MASENLFKVDSEVFIQNLVNAEQFNGLTGKVVEILENGRFKINVTSSGFALGKLLSLKPQNLKRPIPFVKECEYFEIQWINEQKGWGLVATQCIPHGTIIFQEKPLFFVPYEQIFLLGSAIEKLSEEEKTIYYNLSHSTGFGDVKMDIFLTNGIAMPGHEASGIFPTITRINHSCIANIHWYWHAREGVEYLMPLKDIKQGEELVGTYNSASPKMDGKLLTFKQRTDHLKEKKGFQCSCPLCTMSLEQRIISDKNRKRYNKLQSFIPSCGNDMPAMQKGVKCALEMLDLLEKDNAPLKFAYTQYELAQYFLNLGQYKNAEKALLECLDFQEKTYGLQLDISTKYYQHVGRLPKKYQKKLKKKLKQFKYHGHPPFVPPVQSSPSLLENLRKIDEDVLQSMESCKQQ